MPESLQDLIVRIQQDGVERAEAQARIILDEARKKANAMVRDAEAVARTKVAQAQRDADLFTERSIRAIGQAARDVVIAVERAVSVMLEQTLRGEVASALTTETVSRMVETVVSAYAGSGQNRLDILLEPEQQRALLALIRTRFAALLQKGVEIRADSNVVSGFRAVLADRHVQHDFTGESITQALSQVLRPHQAEVLRKSLESLQNQESPSGT
jgi:V/A-type H+-transporting ATPase subunit E